MFWKLPEGLLEKRPCWTIVFLKTEIERVLLYKFLKGLFSGTPREQLLLISWQQSNAKEHDWFSCSFLFKFTEKMVKWIRSDRSEDSCMLCHARCKKFSLSQHSRHLFVQIQQWKHQEKVIDVVLMSLLLTLNNFHTFYGSSIVDIDQVNASWEETNSQDSNKLTCNTKSCMLS